MKPKDKALLILLLFYVFFGLVILVNIGRKCCPKRIE